MDIALYWQSFNYKAKGDDQIFSRISVTEIPLGIRVKQLILFLSAWFRYRYNFSCG